MHIYLYNNKLFSLTVYCLLGFCFEVFGINTYLATRE